MNTLEKLIQFGTVQENKLINNTYYNICYVSLKMHHLNMIFCDPKICVETSDLRDKPLPSSVDFVAYWQDGRLNLVSNIHSFQRIKSEYKKSNNPKINVEMKLIIPLNVQSFVNAVAFSEALSAQNKNHLYHKVLIVKKMNGDGLSGKEIAKAFNVSQSTVSRLLSLSRLSMELVFLLDWSELSLKDALIAASFQKKYKETDFTDDKFDRVLNELMVYVENKRLSKSTNDYVINILSEKLDKSINKEPSNDINISTMNENGLFIIKISTGQKKWYEQLYSILLSAVKKLA